jgi:hypothetical protein
MTREPAPVAVNTFEQLIWLTQSTLKDVSDVIVLDDKQARDLIKRLQEILNDKV